MALTLNYLTGFETGGLEEVQAVSGGLVTTTNPRTGDWSLELQEQGDSATFSCFDLVASAGGDYVLGFACAIDSESGLRRTSVAVRDSSNNQIIKVLLQTGVGIWVLSIEDSMGIVVATDSSAANVDNVYNYFELYFQTGASASAELFMDDVSILNPTGEDFSGVPDNFIFQNVTWNNTNTGFFDDYYFLSGAAAASDRYGDFAVKAYQSTDVGATDQGDTLADGTWALVSETPGNSGTSNDAQYQDDTGPNLTGSTITDGGDRPGPSGDSDVTGATIKGAKYISNLMRGAGGGRTHTILHGNSGDGVTATADLGLTTDFLIYEVLSESASIVPTESEFMQMGFSKSATGGQDIFCGDQWAMLGFVPAAPPAGDLPVGTLALLGVGI